MRTSKSINGCYRVQQALPKPLDALRIAFVPQLDSALQPRRHLCCSLGQFYALKAAICSPAVIGIGPIRAGSISQRTAAAGSNKNSVEGQAASGHTDTRQSTRYHSG